MKKVTILDYKLGNITSIVNMLSLFPNLKISVSDKPDVIMNSDKLILPGVGSFGDAIGKGVKETDKNNTMINLYVVLVFKSSE